MECWKKKYTKRDAQTALNAHAYTKQGDKKLKMYLCPNGKDHYHITKSSW